MHLTVDGGGRPRQTLSVRDTGFPVLPSTAVGIPTSLAVQCPETATLSDDSEARGDLTPNDVRIMQSATFHDDLDLCLHYQVTICMPSAGFSLVS